MGPGAAQPAREVNPAMIHKKVMNNRKIIPTLHSAGATSSLPRPIVHSRQSRITYQCAQCSSSPVAQAGGGSLRSGELPRKKLDHSATAPPIPFRRTRPSVPTSTNTTTPSGFSDMHPK